MHSLKEIQLTSTLLPRLAAALTASLLCGCAYIDLNRGIYESTRTREAVATPPGSNRTTLPTYEQYERERLGQPASPPAGSALPASAPGR
jgi:hypothetical protein